MVAVIAILAPMPIVELVQTLGLAVVVEEITILLPVEEVDLGKAVAQDSHVKMIPRKNLVLSVPSFSVLC